MSEATDIRQAMQRFGIIGHSEPLIEAVGRALRVAPIDLSVLVNGESGTGKEFFPKIIHAYSPRKHAKYIAVNCGAIPEGTIDSELFGHEKGAFTGAVSDRKGYFEEADGGTIFLDEVAELPLTTQARLLRVLETGEFIRVGSSQVSKANVRIVAATNVDMAKAVAEGKFREDLYYRLSTVTIPVPPLRDRGADISLLARKFAADFAKPSRISRVLRENCWRRNTVAAPSVVKIQVTRPASKPSNAGLCARSVIFVCWPGLSQNLLLNQNLAQGTLLLRAHWAEGQTHFSAHPAHHPQRGFNRYWVACHEHRGAQGEQAVMQVAACLHFSGNRRIAHGDNAIRHYIGCN